MATDNALNTLIRNICRMDRRQCIERLLHFEEIPLDFDRATLEGMATDRLRHLLMAAVHTRDKYRGSGRAAV